MIERNKNRQVIAKLEGYDHHVNVSILSHDHHGWFTGGICFTSTEDIDIEKMDKRFLHPWKIKTDYQIYWCDDIKGLFMGWK